MDNFVFEARKKAFYELVKADGVNDNEFRIWKLIVKLLDEYIANESK